MSLITILQDALSVWMEELSTRTYERRLDCEKRRIEAEAGLLKARIRAESDLRLTYSQSQYQLAEAGMKLLGAQIEAQVMSFLSLPLETATPLLTGSTQKARLHSEWQTARQPSAPSPRYIEAAPPPAPRLEPILSDGQIRSLIAQSTMRLRSMEPGEAETAMRSLEPMLRQKLPANVAAEVAAEVREGWEKSRY